MNLEIADILLTFVDTSCARCDRSTMIFTEDLRGYVVNKIIQAGALAANKKFPAACPKIMSLGYSYERYSFQNAKDMEEYYNMIQCYIQRLEEMMLTNPCNCIVHQMVAKPSASDETAKFKSRDRWLLSNIIDGKTWKYEMSSENSSEKRSYSCKACGNDSRRITEALRDAKVSRIVKSITADQQNPIACLSILSKAYSIERHAFETGTSFAGYHLLVNEGLKEAKNQMQGKQCCCEMHNSGLNKRWFVTQLLQDNAAIKWEETCIKKKRCVTDDGRGMSNHATKKCRKA